MLLGFLARPTKVVTISSPVTTGYNLRTGASSPSYPLNLLCFINSTVTSDKANTAAFDVGSGWTPGTFVYIKNTSTITGRQGTTGSAGAAGFGAGGTGSTGSTGSTGADGAGGAGGTGGTGAAGNPGNGGSPGSPGGDRKSTRLNSSHT